MNGRCLGWVLIAFATGAMVGTWYQNSRQTYKSEAVIANEIALLEKHEDSPGCKDIAVSNNGWGVTTIQDGVIVWQYDVEQKFLQKMVVDKVLTTAFEETSVDCSKSVTN